MQLEKTGRDSAITMQTGGGAVIGGDATTEGDLVGRDQVQGHKIGELNIVLASPPPRGAEPKQRQEI